MILIYSDGSSFEAVDTDIPFNESECQVIIKRHLFLSKEEGLYTGDDTSGLFVCKVIDEMDSKGEILEVDGCVVRYRPPYKEYEVVCFPEIQDYQEEDWFEQEAFLINTEKGIEDYGYSAYYIPIDRFKG